MVKLSKAQSALLQRFPSGGKASLLTGRGAQAFFHATGSAPINLSTLFSLIKRGLVSQTKDGVGQFDLVITEAGRLALAQADASP